jgi:hypothetical protein
VRQSRTGITFVLFAGLALSVSIAVAVPVALAVVPSAERIAKATVAANKASSRTQALQLELTLRVAGREPIGVGNLVTHPHGLARLELRDAAGRIERHLRLTTEHTASRGGSQVDKPREFLPPLSFLQLDSPDLLQEAFAQYGLDVQAAALAPCGESICYVLGDSSRVPPPLPPTKEELERQARIDAAGRPRGWKPYEPTPKPEPRPEPDDPDEASEKVTPAGPSVWVDSRSFEIVRMEEPGGPVVRFGPIVDFEGVRFPDSIMIEEPGFEPVRLDILGVKAVNAPAAGFSYDWLLAPQPEP